MTRRDFVAGMKLLLSVYRGGPGPSQVDLWYEQIFKGRDGEIFMKVCRELATTPAPERRGEPDDQFPLPVTLLERMAGRSGEGACGKCLGGKLVVEKVVQSYDPLWDAQRRVLAYPEKPRSLVRPAVCRCDCPAGRRLAGKIWGGVPFYAELFGGG